MLSVARVKTSSIINNCFVLYEISLIVVLQNDKVAAWFRIVTY
jgi:hypothetical protein